MASEISRTDKIESYGQAFRFLTEALERYPKGMWQFKPAADEWSIHEIVVHITDSEANSYVRCRRLVAEPGRDLMAYDENRWARDLAYEQQSVDDALELFRWLRARSYRLVKTLPDRVWQHQAFHPEDGMITLEDWLDTYERHVPEHVSQMDAVYEKWLAGRQSDPPG